MRDEIIFSQEQLDKKLLYWQKKLRLQDWIIEAKISRSKEMIEGVTASVNWTLNKKMASVQILDHIDYPDDVMGTRDMENDLVHELLHLHFAPINDHFSNDDETYHMFEEQAIESITSGLINTERNEAL